MSRTFEICDRRIEPWYQDDALAGLRTGRGRTLWFPGIGLEHEAGVAVAGARGQVQPALEALLARRGDVSAGGRADPSAEADRQFCELGCSYREGDHLELNTWLRRDATAARWNLELWFARAAALAAEDPVHETVLHATGGDPFGSSWSSLHVNVPISDLGYDRLLASQRACEVALDWYLPAQLSLAVVDGNGGVGPDGYLLSDRLGAFDTVWGSCTLRPLRALVVDRAERFGNARVMCMLRALSFGRASCAGLVMTQLDVLIADLMVHGVVHVAPVTRLGDPIAAARELAGHGARRAAATLQRRVQAVRRGVVDWLAQALGEDGLDALVPRARLELDFVDRALAAVERDDEQELLACCDWARKHATLRSWLRGREWATALPELQELNVHYARFDDRALRHHWPDAAIPPTHRPDPEPRETSSWLLYHLCRRARRDPSFARQLDRVQLSWKGLRRDLGGWVEPQGGAWPWAQRRTETVDLAPHRFARAQLAPLLGVDDDGDCGPDIDALFELLGTETTRYGDYAGRSWGADHPGAPSPDPTTSDPAEN
ncbi:MAG: hypothetical protein AB7O97_20195 [Planctomycetota bacterium]